MFVGPLLTFLEDAARWKSLPSRRSDAPLHAIFLLAALEAGEAWETLESILRKDFERFVDDFFGDILTECLPWAVARIAREKTAALAKLAEDSTLNTWIRNCSAKALIIQVLLWPETKERVMECFRRWLNSAHLDPDPYWATNLVSCLADLGGPAEIQKEIEDVFEKGLVDPLHIEIEDVFGPPQRHQACKTIFDIYRSYNWLIGWHDPKAGGKRNPKRGYLPLK